MSHHFPGMPLANIFLPPNPIKSCTFGQLGASGYNTSFLCGYVSVSAWWPVLCLAAIWNQLWALYHDGHWGVWGWSRKGPLQWMLSKKEITSLPVRVGMAPRRYLEKMISGSPGSRRELVRWSCWKEDVLKSIRCPLLGLFWDWSYLCKIFQINSIQWLCADSVFCICSEFNPDVVIVEMDLSSCGSRHLFKH